jgi:Raf kinase inhibitor-like YbhB/YbcL family protein
MGNTSTKIKGLLASLLALSLVFFMVLSGCAGASSTGTITPGGTSPGITSPTRAPTSTNTTTASPTATSLPTLTYTLSLTSLAFKDGEKIPAKYTQDGENVSPPLAWDDPPAGTQSLALICEDLDGPSGIITHWIIFNIPASSRGLDEGIPTEAELPDGTKQGNNVRSQPGYVGPRPPEGTTHRYRFTLYALERTLELSSGVNRTDFLAAIEGHILAQGQITGTYQR